jgi:flagellar hook-associated protein 2
VGLSSPGIGSSLDINSIISQLMAVESRPLSRLAAQEASHKTKLTALGSLQSALSSFQTVVNDLNKTSKFQAMTVSSSDTAVIKASVGDTATAGSYSINITQLAQAQSLAANGQSSTTAAIGAGTATAIRFQFGTVDGITFTENPELAGGAVTIDSSNNSLQGIRDAINQAKIGVTATIVSDGSASPHRLVLTSDQTGAASSMKITVDGEAALSDLLTYDPAGTQKLEQTSAAQDALLTVNGISVRSAGNEIKEAIQGATLSAVALGSSTVSVTRDTATITSAVNGFVKAYNDLNKTLSNLTAYNPETRQGGALVGDSTVRSIQTRMRGMLNTMLDNAGSLRHLSDIGVSFQKDGTLSVDSGKLQKAISNNSDDVAALFATMGKASDSLVSYQSASAATQAGQYDVYVTSLATQGKLAGSAPASLSIMAGSNDSLSVTINGVTASVTLASGSYTIDSLVAHLQSTINGAKAFSDAGIAATVSADTNGILTVMSDTYGSGSKVEINGTGADDLLGAGRVATTGTDIKGTIGGMPATGSGQQLTGAAGSAAEGLRVRITGGAENASRGTITFAYGYAHQLSQLMDTYLGSKGLITARTDGLNSTLKDLGNRRDSISRRLEQVEQRYRVQFTALDTMISSMNQTSTYLAQQLANLPKIE